MRAAIVQDGKVIDILTVASMVHYQGCIEASEEVQIGWSFDGFQFHPPAVTAQEIEQAMTDAIQAHLDATAQEMGYDGILSAVSYSASSHPKFGPEGRAALAWRDACWDYAYQVLFAAKAGARAIPTSDELIAELPALTVG